MLGSTAIIKFLELHNVRNIFYLPGIHTIPLSNALKARNINIFLGRHEANLIFMADGFARASGCVGVVIITPGPGLGNVVSGSMEAHGSDVPLLIVHIDTRQQDKGKGILHDVAEAENILRPVTKKTISVSHQQDLVPALDDAYHTALEQRQGPVLVSLPYPLLQLDVPFDLPMRERRLSSSPLGEEQGSVEDVLKGKKRPVIIGGRSITIDGADTFLNEISGGSSIPFLTTTSGKGILNEESPWCFGNVRQRGVVKEILERADLIIAVGTRLRRVDGATGSLRGKDLIHADVDATWMDRNCPAKLKIAGDPIRFLTYLRDLLKDKRFDWDIDALRKKQESERKFLSRTSKGYQLVSLIRKAIPRESVTVWDMNLLAYWAEYYFSSFSPRTFIMPTGISPIFYGLPAAIGAKIARPDRPCLSVCGDGGVLPTLSELSTIARYNIPVVILVYNNNSFGILEDAMKSAYGLEGEMALHNPDFVKAARSFGIMAKRARTLGGLKDILGRETTWEQPFLIELDYPVFPPPWRA